MQTQYATMPAPQPSSFGPGPHVYSSQPAFAPHFAPQPVPATSFGPGMSMAPMGMHAMAPMGMQAMAPMGMQPMGAQPIYQPQPNTIYAPNQPMYGQGTVYQQPTVMPQQQPQPHIVNHHTNFHTTVAASNASGDRALLPVPQGPIFRTAVPNRPPIHAGVVGTVGINGHMQQEGGYTAPAFREPPKATVAPAYGAPIVGRAGRAAFARHQAFKTLQQLGMHDAARKVYQW